MSQKYKVNFATFCHAGDAHRLHAQGQILRQIKSNNYLFDLAIIVYQKIRSLDYVLTDFHLPEMTKYCFNHWPTSVFDIDGNLKLFDIDLNKSQYASETDNAHFWKSHVVNHLLVMRAVSTDTNYIVFADNDCWMVRQPEGKSWIDKGIEIIENRPEIFIVSPNDGEPERQTRRMSQQMFLVSVDQFRYADFNQPNWDGNVDIPGGPMPEYWAMLEGRMELHCRVTGQYRYVLGPEYRYWHHNKLTKDDLFETDISKY